MLNSVFTKTLYEKRWMMLGWSLGIFALVVFTVALFPTFKEALGESLKDVPDSLRSLLGDANAYSTIKGYLNLQVFQQMPFMTIILSAILFSGLLAGDENEGTLQSLLAQPINRLRVFWEKLAAGAVILLVANIGILLGSLVGTALAKESITVGELLPATFAAWVIAMVIGVFTYFLGAITGKRGFSGGIAGALAFTTYLITNLAAGVESLRTVEKLSPFHYYNQPSIIENGINWAHIGVLVSSIIIMVAVSAVIFKRRDIYQR